MTADGPVPAGAADGGHLTSEALTELVFLSDPQLSADGRRAFCVRTRVERPTDGVPAYRAQVCEVSLDGTGPPLRPLAEGARGSDHPRPSPDGRRLAFLSVRDGHDEPQVHGMDLERGGESRPWTRLAGGARGFTWHPGGRSLLVYGSDERPAPKGDAVVARAVTRLHAKEDGLPHPGLRTSHPSDLWHVDLEETGSTTPRRVATFPDGVADAVWSPDAGALWILAAETVAEADDRKASLWRLDFADDGTAGETVRVRSALTMPSSLAISEDGGTLAWIAPIDPDDPTSVQGLWTWRPPGPGAGTDAPRVVSGERAATPAVGGDARHGRYPNRPVSTSDGWVVNVNVRGASAPCVLTEGGESRPRAGGARVATAFAHAGDRTLMIVESPQHPGELVLVEADGRERALTDENGPFVLRYGLVAGGEERTAPNGADGVPWWRLDPARARPDGAIVVQVHGGPRTNVGYGFHFEFQLLAARGYAVVSLNPRGSSSYGHAYGTAMVGAYGTVDAEDVLAVVDAATRDAEPTNGPDGPPVHLMGGSYGGFMTNWLVTRTDRFRSAVTQRSICNWLSFYGTSDIGYRFAEAEIGGTPWRDTDRLWAQSPLSRVDGVTTPILILHADADHRCPVEQAEQWFVALSRIGRAETRLVRFPDEGHELSRSGRPDRRIRRLDEITGWIETHP